MEKIKVLLVSNNLEQCGVFQFIYNINNILKTSETIDYTYIKCRDISDFWHWLDAIKPAVVIYNYHVSTLGWLNENVTATVRSKGAKQLIIHHEYTHGYPGGLDGVISQDPDNIEDSFNFKIGRLVHSYVPTTHSDRQAVPRFGSFGFGFGDKGYDRFLNAIQKEFDEAEVRFHISFAYHGDVSGVAARDWATKLNACVYKPGIKVEVTHNWRPLNEMLDWLGSHDLNGFFYSDNYGRGISSTIDFALSAKKPIVITTSHQFKHVRDAVPTICYNEDNPNLKEIMANGLTPLLPFYEKWSEENLKLDFERIIRKQLA